MKKNLLLLLFSTLFTLIILEIGLQVIGIDQPKVVEAEKTEWKRVPEEVWTEYHSTLGWVNQKNKSAAHSVARKQIIVHTNSKGMRGQKEYTQKKPYRVTRLMLLGDSFVFGFGVPDEETFGALLEASRYKIEAPNLGVPAYGIAQIYLSYSEIARDYESDYVFICIFPDGFFRSTMAFADSGHANPYFSLSSEDGLLLQNVPVPESYTLKTNQFPNLIEYSSAEKLLRKSLLYRLVKKQLIRLGKNTGWLDPDQTVDWIVGKALLRKFIGDVRRDSRTPVIMTVPPDRWVKDNNSRKLHKSLLRFAKKENVDLIDLVPIFREAVAKEGLTTYYIEHDWHWTLKGHQLVADTILKFINDNK